MSYKKLAELAYKLGERTSKGVVDWEETVHNGHYQTEINGNSIQISREYTDQYHGDEVEYDYIIKIFNELGNEVESFSDVDIAEVMPNDSNSYQILSKMYKDARRKALGTDKVLDSIIEGLSDDGLI